MKMYPEGTPLTFLIYFEPAPRKLKELKGVPSFSLLLHCKRTFPLDNNAQDLAEKYVSYHQAATDIRQIFLVHGFVA